MIERYTIKFGPAVSQKELEKILATGEAKFQKSDLHKLKVRIEFIAEFEDMEKADALIKALSKRPASPEIQEA